MFSTMALGLVVFVVLTMAILFVWIRLKETTKLLNLYIAANDLRDNMYDKMADCNSRLLIYLLKKYFDNGALSSSIESSVDYNSLSGVISKIANVNNVPYATAQAVLISATRVATSFDRSARFTKLALTLHCAVANKSLRNELVFNEHSLTADEICLVEHLIKAYTKNEVSYDPTKYNPKEITLKFPAGVTKKQVYEIYTDVVKRYKNSLHINAIPHPCNLATLRRHNEILLNVEMCTAEKPEFVKINSAVRLIVAMITAYAIIENEEIYPFFTGEYALAIYLRTIILDEKRKSTLSVM